MNPIFALRRLDVLRRKLAAHGLRLQRDAQGRPRLVLWDDERSFIDPHAHRIRDAEVDPAIADILEIAECCPDGHTALDHNGTLHLVTLDADGPQAARPLGRFARFDVRLPNRGPGFGGVCLMPRDGHALLLLPGDDAPAPSGHRILAFAVRAIAAGFPPTEPTKIQGLRTGLLVLRRENRICLLPIEDSDLRIASWPLHSSVRQREGGDQDDRAA